ncbi:MAG: glycosyltransferase [Ruminococcaceae bacterium]|nr:glycosyltransferase [Oscillospiraceae bacterium]
MRIILISNFHNHHQMPLCDGFLQIPNVEFTFIATEKVPQKRVTLGYAQTFDHLPYYREAIEPQDAIAAEQLCFDSDVVIIGSAPMTFIKRRLQAKKLTFTYNERWFKQGFWHHPGDIYRAVRAYTLPGNRNFYQLCASAYTAFDSNRIFAFPGRKLRWGYFPEVKKQDISALMAQKEPATLLWAGRFLCWKHPEMALTVAKRLKEDGISFCLSMIGGGEEEQQIRTLIRAYDLEDCVALLGTMSPEEVRIHMERSAVFLFTSDFNEGWGAVLNEAMNSGCAVVASHAIGAAPYLLRQGENGFIYQNGDLEGLYQYTKKLLTDPVLREKLGKEAYRTMTECWNATVAAGRLYDFAQAKLTGEKVPSYPDGPMSEDRGKVKNYG